MAQENTKYPIGTQTFSIVREENFVYVDKTEYVYKMTHSDMRYVFLSRPRRFGKSLLVSTLKSYFEGDRELFKGLAIEKLETEWKHYPVLHFDMSTAKHVDQERLVSELSGKLARYERIYGRDEADVEINQRLRGLIERIYERENQKVVVLIDEYDAPLLDVVHEEENLPKLRNVMRNFYSPLKACEPYLRFVFMTGITKFSQLSIFSELNNIANISMEREYAAICGISEEEMLAQMPEGLDRIASELDITREEAVERVKAMYDGYHFTWPSPDIYNPFSLVNAFSRGRLDSFWFGSGTPTYLIEMLRKFQVDPEKIGGRQVKSSDFDAPTEMMNNITPLLYQSGYVTITDYDEDSELYTLDIPNKEVRSGLMESMVPFYVPGKMVEDTNRLNAKFYTAVRKGEIDNALRMLQEYLKTIPYTNDSDSEGSWQRLLYVIFDMGGKDIEAEVELHTADGRIDLTVKTKDTIYVMELKVGKTAAEAMRQIEEKDYAARFALDSRPVVKVGINFDNASRTVSDWIIK